MSFSPDGQDKLLETLLRTAIEQNLVHLNRLPRRGQGSARLCRRRYRSRRRHRRPGFVITSRKRHRESIVLIPMKRSMR
jgi:hypothetical protein